jgi:uncharacterized protein
MSEKANIAFVHITARDADAAAQFYSTVYGMDLASWEADGRRSYYAPIYNGVDVVIQGSTDSPERSDPHTTVFYAVDDLDSAVADAEGAGGSVRSGPVELGQEGKTTLGRATIVTDPSGVPVGLVQLSEHAHDHFALGNHGSGVSNERKRAHEEAVAR